MQFWIDQGVTAMETDYPAVLFNLLTNPQSGDFDADGDVDGEDWLFYVAGLGALEPGATDLTADGVNNHADFLRFRQLYEDFNGDGSFVEMLARAPEPFAAVMLLELAAILILPLRKRNSIRSHPISPAPSFSMQ